MSSFVARILEIPTDQLRKCKETNPKCPGRISKKSKEARNGNQNKVFKCLCPKILQQNFPFNFLTKTYCCHLSSCSYCKLKSISDHGYRLSPALLPILFFFSFVIKCLCSISLVNLGLKNEKEL